MAITVIQAAPVINAASLTTATVTLANPTGAGNSLVVCVTTHADTTNPSVSTITLGGAADNFAAVETNVGGGVGINGAIWYDPGCAAGQTSVVVTCTGGAGTNPNIWVAVYEVSGVLLADKHTSAVGTAVTTWSSGATATTAQANEIFIGAATGTTSIPTVTGVGTWNSLSNGTGLYDLISGSQIVSSTGTATYSGTMTSGNFLALVATFSQVSAAAPPVPWFAPAWHPGRGLPGLPGATPFWVPAPGATAPVVAAAPPPPPRGTPVQARILPQRGGTVSRRSGIYGQTGAPVKPQAGPARARIPQPPRGGQVSHLAGPYGQAGAPVKPATGPVRARVPLGRGGHTSSRAGVFGGLGPAVKALASAVQARRLPQRGGSAQGRTGTFTGAAPQAGPPVYPLGHPVQARRPLPPGGRSAGRTGIYAQAGPPVRPLSHPVATVQRGLPAAGGAAGIAVPPAPVTATPGAPIYPLGHPVQARRQPLAGGRVVRRAGTYAGTGSPLRPATGPVGVYRRQPPPPTRGRTASQRGPYGGTGPAAIPLRRPVRGQPAKPVRTGRAAWRAGVYTAPIVAPFTPGALSAADAPAGTLTARTAASADSIYGLTYTAAYLPGSAPVPAMTAFDAPLGTLGAATTGATAAGTAEGPPVYGTTYTAAYTSSVVVIPVGAATLSASDTRTGGPA